METAKERAIYIVRCCLGQLLKKTSDWRGYKLRAGELFTLGSKRNTIAS